MMYPYIFSCFICLWSFPLWAQLQPLPEKGGQLVLAHDSIFYLAPQGSYYYRSGQFFLSNSSIDKGLQLEQLAWGVQERYILALSQNFRAGYWAKDLDQSEALLEQKKAESWQSFRLLLPSYEDAYIYSILERGSQLYLCIYIDGQHYLQLIEVEPQPLSLE